MGYYWLIQVSNYLIYCNNFDDFTALNPSEKVFTPSILLAVDDQIVPYSLLKFCVQCYVPSDIIIEGNPYISSISAPDEVIFYRT